MAKPAGKLKRGWTTGACATAAARAAYAALLGDEFPDPVTITLPKGQQPSFALALEGRGDGWARAGIVKDAGDDPDVTHGALVICTVSTGPAGSGVRFRAGTGVGTVTKPGLPVAVGEPAINPVPRRMMTCEIEDLAASHGVAGDVIIEISVPDGEALAQKTWNPRLGITGGISILGTTGIVVPFSCSAWIASIHRGIDVARAMGLEHIAGSTGSVSEATVKAHYGLRESALMDMGDFVGGMLKYVRRHPVRQVTVCGGFAKMAKMARGALDLHSGRSQVDFDWLAERVRLLDGSEQLARSISAANTAMQAEALARGDDIPLASDVANNALEAGYRVLRGSKVSFDILVTNRKGEIIGRAS